MIKKNINLLDKNRSYLPIKKEEQYRREITKQKNSPICKFLTTITVAKKGAEAMSKDNFCLVKEKIDV